MLHIVIGTYIIYVVKCQWNHYDSCWNDKLFIYKAWVVAMLMLNHSNMPDELTYILLYSCLEHLAFSLGIYNFHNG